MDLGNFFSAIIIGGLAGWVASLIMKTDKSMGLVANVVVGVVGAVVGNLLVGVFGSEGTNGSTFQSFLVALLGAVVLLFLLKMVTGRR